MQPRILRDSARLAGAPLLRLQSDERLIALTRDGHDPAYAAIVHRYRPALLRHCERIVGPARAEDAVQQAFVNAHAALRADDRPIDMRPWLYRIAQNVSLNLLRTRRDEAPLDPDVDAAATAAVTDAVELRERLRTTLAAIDELPPKQRDAILLRAFEGRSHEEIAGALGVTPGAARQHLLRARAALRAAATAVTPYPAAARAAEFLAGPAGGARLADAAATTGLVATASKVGAGVLAAGALVAGARVADVPPARHHPAPPARHGEAAAPHALPRVVPPASAVRRAATPAPARPARTRRRPARRLARVTPKRPDAGRASAPLVSVGLGGDRRDRERVGRPGAAPADREDAGRRGEDAVPPTPSRTGEDAHAGDGSRTPADAPSAEAAGHDDGEHAADASATEDHEDGAGEHSGG